MQIRHISSAATQSKRAEPNFGLKMAIVTSDAAIHPNDTIIHFLKAASRSQHEVEILGPQNCMLENGADGLRIQAGQKTYNRDSFDVVIPRIMSDEASASSTYSAMALLRHLQAMGVPALNTAKSIETANDKLQTHQLLTKHNIPNTFTIFTKSANCISHLLAKCKEVVIKGTQGAGGKGVEKYPLEEVSKVLEQSQAEKRPIIAQPFQASAKGMDHRSYVMLDSNGEMKVVAGKIRTAPKGDFRANISLGGAEKVYLPQADEEALAIRTAKAMKLDLAAVDTLHTQEGIEVLEVNATPGLMNTNVDNLALALVKAAEAKAIAKKVSK